MSMGGGIFGRPVGIQYGDLLDEGMGAPVDNPAFRQPMPGAPMTPIAKLGGGFFGEGGTGRAIAGSLGDALMQMGGMRPIYGPTMQQRRQQAYEQQQREAQRVQEWDDFTRQYDYKRANPMPSTTSPYRFEDNAGNVWELGPDGKPGPQPLFVDKAPKQIIQDGQLITVPNPFASAAPARPAGPAIGTIRNNYRFKGGDPNNQASWEPVAQGGPTQPASGGFRR